MMMLYMNNDILSHWYGRASI